MKYEVLQLASKIKYQSRTKHESSVVPVSCRLTPKDWGKPKNFFLSLFPSRCPRHLSHIAPHLVPGAENRTTVYPAVVFIILVLQHAVLSRVCDI